MAHAPRRRHVLPLLLALATALTAAQTYVDEVNTAMARLVIRAHDRDRLNSLGFYGIRCARLLDQAIATQSQLPSRKLTIAETPDTGAPQNAVLFVPSEDELPFARRLLRELLSRRLEDLTGKRPDEAPFRSLVADGLAHRFVFGRRALSGFYEPDYEIARNQFMRKDFPRIDLLLSSLPPEQEPILMLHLMHADLLVAMLESLSTPHGQLVQDILVAEQNGESAAQAAERLTASLRSDGDSLQALYERRILRAAQRQRRLSGEDVIQERVRELETVPVIGVEGATAIRRVPLDDLPDILKDYHNDPQGLLRLERRFNDLRLASPYLLRDALQAYAHALSWLRNGDIPRFRDTIRQARAQFRQALDKQQRLQTLMDDFEARNTPTWHRFDSFLRIIRRYHDLADSLYGHPLLPGTPPKQP